MADGPTGAAPAGRRQRREAAAAAGAGPGGSWDLRQQQREMRRQRRRTVAGSDSEDEEEAAAAGRQAAYAAAGAGAPPRYGVDYDAEVPGLGPEGEEYLEDNWGAEVPPGSAGWRGRGAGAGGAAQYDEQYSEAFEPGLMAEPDIALLSAGELGRVGQDRAWAMLGKTGRSACIQALLWAQGSAPAAFQLPQLWSAQPHSAACPHHPADELERVLPVVPSSQQAGFFAGSATDGVQRWGASLALPVLLSKVGAVLASFCPCWAVCVLVCGWAAASRLAVPPALPLGTGWGALGGTRVGC